MIARDAVVVSPLTTRMRPITSSSMMQGTSVRHVPVQEVVLAIDRQDVAGVTDVLEMGLEMDCIARSSRPNSEDNTTPPPGMVAVPVAVRFVSAYSEIVHDDLYDVRTRDLRFAFLTPEEVKSQKIIVDASELVGRVVERDRPAGQFFRQEDLTAPRHSAGADRRRSVRQTRFCHRGRQIGWLRSAAPRRSSGSLGKHSVVARKAIAGGRWLASQRRPRRGFAAHGEAGRDSCRGA